MAQYVYEPVWSDDKELRPAHEENKWFPSSKTNDYCYRLRLLRITGPLLQFILETDFIAGENIQRCVRSIKGDYLAELGRRQNKAVILEKLPHTWPIDNSPLTKKIVKMSTFVKYRTSRTHLLQQQIIGIENILINNSPDLSMGMIEYHKERLDELMRELYMVENNITQSYGN